MQIKSDAGFFCSQNLRAETKEKGGLLCGFFCCCLGLSLGFLFGFFFLQLLQSWMLQALRSENYFMYLSIWTLYLRGKRKTQ